MSDQKTETAESVAIQKFVAPIEHELQEWRRDDGSFKCVIRSDAQLQRAALCLGMVRRNLKALESYFKEDPGRDASLFQGMCYFARRNMEAVNTVFNKIKQPFLDQEAELNGAIKKYRSGQEEPEKVEGLSERHVWRAELTDIVALCRAIVDNPQLAGCIKFDQSGANKLATAFGGVNPPAGLKFVPDVINSTRRVK